MFGQTVKNMRSKIQIEGNSHCLRFNANIKWTLASCLCKLGGKSEWKMQRSCIEIKICTAYDDDDNDNGYDDMEKLWMGGTKNKKLFSAVDGLVGWLVVVLAFMVSLCFFFFFALGFRMRFTAYYITIIDFYDASTFRTLDLF